MGRYFAQSDQTPMKCVIGQLVPIAAFAATLAGSAPHPHRPPAPPQEARPLVVFETSRGVIAIRLEAQRAPKTVRNFLTYVGLGFYDGLIFHRVIRHALIQTGLTTPGDQPEKRQPLAAPVQNEAQNGLHNVRGTVAMARADDPHGADAEFFINVENHPNFDYESPTLRGWGYAVFGYVVRGMDVVDEIASVPTQRRGTLRNLPVDPVIIYAAYEVESLDDIPDD